jgi:F0F1-type ATP synthase assembly protein I
MADLRPDQPREMPSSDAPRGAEKPGADQANWSALAGIGFQVVVGVGLGVAVGMWIDKRRGSAPWGLLIGAGVGLAAGLYSLIREGIRANRD